MKLSIPKPKGKAGGVVELVVIVALALVLALGIQAWIVKPYQIPSESMEPTLDVGQRILVNRFIYHFHNPRVGDIIVFHPPEGTEEASPSGGECGEVPKQGYACDKPTEAEAGDNFVKRLVAVPGDRVRVINGRAIVNGEESSAANGAANESCGPPLPRKEWKSAQPDGHCNFPKTIVVPPDHYFMMGDNRGNSDDSRFWGPIPKAWIIGEAFATYWPPDRIGGL
jgi:signal peptidase I